MISQVNFSKDVYFNRLLKQTLSAISTSRPNPSLCDMTNPTALPFPGRPNPLQARPTLRRKPAPAGRKRQTPGVLVPERDEPEVLSGIAPATWAASFSWVLSIVAPELTRLKTAVVMQVTPEISAPTKVSPDKNRNHPGV